jgi:hypothetical protein
MPTRHRLSIALISVVVASMSVVSSALAGQPGTVTVRVVGLTGTTLLPQTQVTTTTTPLLPDGEHECPSTDAGGALYDATHGNWVVKYDSGLGYEIDGLQGLNFPAFSPSSPPDAYWSFWLNGAPASMGACEQELAPGADLVFFAQCTSIGTDCPSDATAPHHFLTESFPNEGNVQLGTPVKVTVGSLSTETGSSEPLPGGVSVNAGSISVAPDTHGVATLNLPSVGTYTLEAAAPGSVPSDPQTICVHDGNDGLCGTSGPGSSIPKGLPSPQVLPPPIGSIDRVIAGGAGNGYHYRHHAGPRILTGVVTVPAGAALRQVRISLLRRHGERCQAFSGVRAKFVRARCGSAHFFSVGATESFSYLLPGALPAGRYVYEVEAVDAAGHVTKPVLGTSKVVFYVH